VSTPICGPGRCWQPATQITLRRSPTWTTSSHELQTQPERLLFCWRIEPKTPPQIFLRIPKPCGRGNHRVCGAPSIGVISSMRFPPWGLRCCWLHAPRSIWPRACWRIFAGFYPGLSWCTFMVLKVGIRGFGMHSFLAGVWCLVPSLLVWCFSFGLGE
jgi:hypothetical protein